METITETNRLNLTSTDPATPERFHKFRISDEVIEATCAQVSSDMAATLRWASGWCRDRNLSPGEFGDLLRQPNSTKPYSGDSVYQAFTGRRDGGSLERFCESIENLRKRVDSHGPRLGSMPFIEWRMSKAIFRTCETALRRNRISFIFGPSQTGKTTALAEFKRRNHGSTTMLRIPTGGSLPNLVAALAVHLGINSSRNSMELRRRIFDAFTAEDLLIVDECHAPLTSGRGSMLSLDFLREIHDETKCGMVLCGTQVFKDSLRTNKILEQLWLRCYRPLTLPSQPTAADLVAFSETFGLTPAEDRLRGVEVEVNDEVKVFKASPLKLQTEVIAKSGLGRWCSILEDAASIAAEADKKPTWNHVIAAWAQFQE